MKIPFQFNFNLLCRVYIPGLIFSLFSFPILSFFLKSIKLIAEPGMDLIFISAFFWGILIIVLDYKIYQVFEGRLLWPEKCFEKRRKRWGKYIRKLQKRIEETQRTRGVQSPQARELWYKIRAFPLDEKCRYYSYFPTKLGNVICAYEDYPMHRYGIEAVFYWYRLWFKLDENSRKDLDSFASKADMTVYSSFVFFVVFILNLIFLVFLVIFKNQPFMNDLEKSGSSPPSFECLIIIVVTSLLLSAAFYKLSIPLHRNYGEYFKSIFDLNKDMLKEAFTKDFSDELKKNPEQIRRYLQYYRIKCTHCGKVNPTYLPECETCKNKLPSIFE